jgi:uncharacterized membrane protein YbhN (UPF0104 family)
VSAKKKAWSTAWRVAVGAVLLVWIVHSIFVDNARKQAQLVGLVDRGITIDAIGWEHLARPEQWRLGWTYGPPALWKTLHNVDPGMFALSILLMGSTVALGIIRWRMVLRVHGFDLPFGRATEISLVAHFFNSFLLGTAGGDVMKAFYAARETHHKKTEAVLTVFVDRVIGLWSMLLFAVIMMIPNRALLGSPKIQLTALLVVGMTVAATVFILLAFRGGVSNAWSGARPFLRKLPRGDWLERTLDSCRTFGRAPGFLLRTVAVSMALNAACVLQFIAVARGLHLVISPLVLFMIVPMIVAISALPISPSGIGVRENLFVEMLAMPAIGVAATPALSLSLLGLAGSLAWSIIGGMVYVLFKRKHHLAEQELTTAD